MRRSLSLLPVLALAASASAAFAQPQAAPILPDARAGKWGPAPDVFPAGLKFAVIQGDPSKAGPYTVRLRMPNGYRIAPHTHPTDENVTVLQGHLHLGMGDAFKKAGTANLGTGGFAIAGAGKPHYVWADGETIVQVHGMGPFQLKYVNPADDPRTKAKASR